MLRLTSCPLSESGILFPLQINWRKGHQQMKMKGDHSLAIHICKCIRIANNYLNMKIGKKSLFIQKLFFIIIKRCIIIAYFVEGIILKSYTFDLNKKILFKCNSSLLNIFLKRLYLWTLTITNPHWEAPIQQNKGNKINIFNFY